MTVAVPVVIWYLVGDLSSPGFSPAQLDYVINPLPISPFVEHGLGILAMALIVASSWMLYRNQKNGLVRYPTWIILGLLVATGLIVGFSWRVLTAGGIGANIGAGLMILFALPVAGLLALAALTYLTVLLVIQRRQAISG
ncbi:hypothetical protein AB0L13_47775 [Saccharopolyspora shandongensis]|uniref:hypothetical protein n=1 Tax=Saccharopolyspora shandongensis TaxID=418495 RepID=UPI0034464CF8